jgi:UDP-N-acetyl-D-glucosamine dehydrogenase
MPDYVVSRVQTGLNERGRAVKGSRVLVLGLAYKRNTGDARESPAVVIARRLLGFGAVVRAVDPHVFDEEVPPGVVPVDATPEELSRADLVVMLTDHDAFDKDSIVRHARSVLDTRHSLAGATVEYL